MPADYCLVLCSCPNADTANELALALVEQRLAACVNLLPGVTSVYGWEGRALTASEQLLLIKTETAGVAGLETFIKQRHPYEVPEIIAIPIERGNQDYFDWISAWVGQRS
jgi:periplasmic divalent cation tolerance protein